MRPLLRNRMPAAAIALASILTACTLQGNAPPSEAAYKGLAAARYREAEAAGRRVLHVLPERSLVMISVRRGGVLARLGHDHVVASRDVRGELLPDENVADLDVPLSLLAVDEPALRARAGLDSNPSEAAIRGTRGNMLDKVLEVDRFPLAHVHIERASASRKLDVLIDLHGVTRRFDVPADLTESPDGFIVSGNMAFNQSDFGIEPFSVLGGALRVEDRLELAFHIEAAGRNVR